MRKRAEEKIPKKQDFERIDATIQKGLTSEQVQIRVDAHAVNNVRKPIGKSYTEIFVHNFLNIYNLIMIVIAAMLIYAENYSSLFFAAIYLANLAIGLYQDLKARHLLSKLQLVTQSKVFVIRDGNKIEIPTTELVVDDIVILKSGDQVSADSIVLEGTVGCNESILSGESQTVYIEKSGVAYAGSVITSGTCYARVLRVGKENYIDKLESKARENKAVSSHLKKSLDNLLRIILIVVLLMCVLIFVSMFFADKEIFEPDHLPPTIGKIAGSVLAMVPAGLYLLASASLTVGVINLARKRTMVQDMYSLEMLARSTMLCLDKTGTITDGTMIVKELVTLNRVKRDEVELMIANVEEATNDDNATARAIKEAFSFKATEKPLYVCPFNSENKYAFVSFKKGTYVIGALECIDANKKEEIEKEIAKYTQRGLRVIVFGKAKENQIGNKVLKGKVDIQALIVLEDHIKDDAEETIQWFQNNAVKIRVISGDNAQTVSQIARRVGIHDADRYISLDGKTLEEVKELADKYIVFGRVTPEQKEVLVETFKEKGETVAMTGDGVNDILALRKADCSIAMANGADAAQNVSQLIMLDSNFSSLPAVVAEGRRTINNIQRTSSLFLTKTVFAIVLTLIFTISTFMGGPFYPFETNHLYLWELSTIGIGSFFIALEPNSEPIAPGFMRNISKKCLPAAAMMMVGAGLFFMLYSLQKNGIMYTGVPSEKIFQTMSSIFFAVGAVAIFYRICSPLSKYRLFVIIGAIIINVGGLGLSSIIFHPGTENAVSFGELIFKIDLFALTPINYLELACISIGLVAIYIVFTYVFGLLGKRKKERKSND